MVRLLHNALPPPDAWNHPLTQYLCFGTPRLIIQVNNHALYIAAATLVPLHSFECVLVISSTTSYSSVLMMICSQQQTLFINVFQSGTPSEVFKCSLAL